MTYNAFLTTDHVKNARIIAAHVDGITVDECFAFGEIFEFLNDNPDQIANNRGPGGRRPNILVESGVKELAEKWMKGRRQIPTLALPRTIADPAVLAIMKDKFNYYVPAINVHFQAMAAENIIGTLLEMYIASEMEHYGWTWCAGEIIKAVDFLKKTDDGFIPLQVKNRSNSENSSSAAIRNGTSIIKWHRINAYTAETHWDDFPEEELRGVLTEKNFQKFIKDNLK